jgi:serine/threonine-protein kinase
VNLKNFFGELQRRNVYRVAVAYGVVSWLLVQIATQVFPFFDIPNWTTRMVIVMLMLGFPVALIIAWIYELTPEGLQRTDEIAPGKSIAHGTGRRIDFVIIGVLLMVIAIMAWRHYHPAGPDLTKSAEKSIAILPFVDISPAKDQEYFSDGITEQIIDSLAHIRSLFVVARTTAFSFKNKNSDIRDIGRQLQVTHVLEGSVRHGKDRVRVTAQLIDVATGFHLWSETYDSTEKDLLSLQSDVARKVAAALKIELHLAENTQLAKLPTENPEAYDLYLRGRYLLNKRTADSIQQGRGLFERAVAQDASFALGHAGIADSFILLGKLGVISPAEASSKAWAEVSAALAIDDDLAEGHVSRGILLAEFEWNWTAAEADYRRALQLNSNSASAHHWFGRALAEMGRADEASREIDAAEKLDSRSPFIRTSKAKILGASHRHQEAIEECRRAIEIDGDFALAFSVLAQGYLHLQRYSQGIETAKKFVELSNGTGFAKLELAYAYGAAGDKTNSAQIVQEVTTGSGPFSPYDMATICAVWGDHAAAFRWLEKAIEQRSVDVVWIRVDPRLDPIRDKPGFPEIVARLIPHR